MLLEICVDDQFDANSPQRARFDINEPCPPAFIAAGGMMSFNIDGTSTISSPAELFDLTGVSVMFTVSGWGVMTADLTLHLFLTANTSPDPDNDPALLDLPGVFSKGDDGSLTFRTFPDGDSGTNFRPKLPAGLPGAIFWRFTP